MEANFGLFEREPRSFTKWVTKHIEKKQVLGSIEFESDGIAVRQGSSCKPIQSETEDDLEILKQFTIRKKRQPDQSLFKLTNH